MQGRRGNSFTKRCRKGDSTARAGVYEPRGFPSLRWFFIPLSSLCSPPKLLPSHRGQVKPLWRQAQSSSRRALPLIYTPASIQLEVTAVTIQPRRKTYLPGASPLPWHQESSSPTGNIMLRFRSPLAARATVLTSSTVGRLCSQTQGTCSANYWNPSVARTPSLSYWRWLTSSSHQRSVVRIMTCRN